MPWFSYICRICKVEFKESFPNRAQFAIHKSCNGVSDNVIKAGTSTVMERLDNGAMAKAVERRANIEELMHEHSQIGNDAPREEDEVDDPNSGTD